MRRFFKGFALFAAVFCGACFIGVLVNVAPALADPPAGGSSGCKPGGICDVQMVRPSAAPGRPAFQPTHFGEHTHAGPGVNDYFSSDGGVITSPVTLEALDFCPRDGGACAFAGGGGAFVPIVGGQMTGGLSTPQVDAGVLYVGGTNIAVPQPAIWLGEQRICLGRNDGGTVCSPGIRTIAGAGIRFGVVESDGGSYNALSLLGNASGGNAGASAQFFDSAGGLNASVRDSTAVSGAGVYGHHLCPLDGGTCWTGQSVGDMKTTADNVMATAVSLFNSDSTAALGFRTGTTGINPSGNWTFQSVNRDTGGSTGDANTVVGGNSSSQFVWRNLLASWTAQCIGSTLTTACSEDTNFTGGISAASPWVNQRVTCAWNTVGTGGTTGVVIQVFDKTTSAELCHCTLGACTTAANSPLSCTCTGAYTASDLYVVRQTSATDCTADPADIICNVQYKL